MTQPFLHTETTGSDPGFECLASSPTLRSPAPSPSASPTADKIGNIGQFKLGGFVRALVRKKANQLVGKAGFTASDREDIEQDIYVKLLGQLESFDPDQAHFNVFVTTVVERYVRNILRNKQAEKRDHRRISSLNVTVDITDEGPTELAQTIGERELDARLGRQRIGEKGLSDLAIDLAKVIATLPKSWQTLLELRKTQTMSEIAIAMGVPRTTLNGWMRQIRQRFDDAGMRNYLELSSSSRARTG